MRRKIFLSLLCLIALVTSLGVYQYRAQQLARYHAEVRERGEAGKVQALARTALAKQLAQQALTAKPNELALGLSVTALQLDDLYETRHALLTLLQRANALTVGKPLVHPDWVFNLALSSDGKTLATAGKDRNILLWDLTTQQKIGQPIKLSEWAHGVAFSPDGKKLAAGTHDNVLTLWNVSTQQKIWEALSDHDGVIFNIAFNPDGKTLVTASRDKTVRLWETETGKQIGEPLTAHTDWVLSAAYAPNGKFFVTGGDKTVRVWDVKTLTSNGFKGHSLFIHGVAVNGDSTLIASGSRDKTARVWDAVSGKQLWQFDHPDWVFAVAFSPDGKMLVTVSRDRLGRLWDLETGKVLGEPLKGHTDWVDAVDFAHQGELLVTGARDNTVRLWSANPKTWIDAACKLAKRNLTPAEWKQFVGEEPYYASCK